MTLLLMLLVVESLPAFMDVPRLSGFVQEQFWWVSRVERLEICKPDVRMHKLQHFFVLVALVPVKAMLLAMLTGHGIRFAGSTLGERAWSTFTYVLWCLLGLVPSWVLFVMFDPLGHSFRISPKRQLEALCGGVTFGYLATMIFVSLVAAACLLPIASGVLTLLCRKPSRHAA